MQTEITFLPNHYNNSLSIYILKFFVYKRWLFLTYYTKHKSIFSSLPLSSNNKRDWNEGQSIKREINASL